MIIREIKIRDKFCKYFCLTHNIQTDWNVFAIQWCGQSTEKEISISSYNLYDELGKKA